MNIQNLDKSGSSIQEIWFFKVFIKFCEILMHNSPLVMYTKIFKNTILT